MSESVLDAMDSLVNPETSQNAAANPAPNRNLANIDETKLLEVMATMRPYLQADGGDVEYIGTTADGVVQVRLQGACGSCPSSTYTLKMGIEEQLKMHVPGVTAVEQV